MIQNNWQKELSELMQNIFMQCYYLEYIAGVWWNQITYNLSTDLVFAVN